MPRSDNGPVKHSHQVNIAKCTETLLQNDPSFVELSLERLGADFDLEKFSSAIRENRTVRQVCFSGTFVRKLKPWQWRTLLESVGFLQSLQELQIWCSTVPVVTLLQTLRNARKLRKVSFFRVSLEGGQQQFNELANVLHTHPELRELRLGGFSVHSGISLSPLLQALSETPQLTVLSLQLSADAGNAPFSSVSLGRLLLSNTIEDLYLSRLRLGHDHLAVIALALLQNKQLKTLDLFGNSIENAHIVLVANAIQTNPSLETLVLPCPRDGLSMVSCAAISRALKKNTSLVTLNLPRTSLCDNALLTISEGLVVNTTLKKIEVGVSDNVGDKGVEALTMVLENNYELERLVVSSAESSIKNKVDYYIRLNELGRGKLLRNDNARASREHWVNMLVSCSEDLDCLFYFITMNPTLCQFANSGTADTIVTEESRPSSRRHTMDCLVVFDDDSRDVLKLRRASAF